MVMPRSRSISIESRIWSCISRSLTARTPSSADRPGCFAVVDMGDDREIADMRQVGHFTLTTQHGASRLGHGGDDLVAHRFDLGIGQRALGRLQGDLRWRATSCPRARPCRHRRRTRATPGDQRLVGSLRARAPASRPRRRHRPGRRSRARPAGRRQDELRPRLGRLRLGRRRGIEEHLERRRPGP